MTQESNSSRHPKSKGVLSSTFAAIIHNPTIPLLFFLIALIESLALTALFLSHSGTFNKILGPIIRRLWGDRFLHYPDNFLLLPKLYNYAHIAVLTTIGLIITAIVIKQIHAWTKNESGSTIFSSAGLAFKKYFPMLLIWIPLYLLIRTASRVIVPYLPQNALIQITSLSVVLVLFQVVSAFIFPSIVLSGKNFFRAVGEGVWLALKSGLLLFAVLIFPIFISVGISYLKAMAPYWIQVNPEVVLYLLYFGIIVNLLIDVFITAVSTLLYLKARNF